MNHIKEILPDFESAAKCAKKEIRIWCGESE